MITWMYLQFPMQLTLFSHFTYWLGPFFVGGVTKSAACFPWVPSGIENSVSIQDSENRLAGLALADDYKQSDIKPDAQFALPSSFGIHESLVSKQNV